MIEVSFHDAHVCDDHDRNGRCQVCGEIRPPANCPHTEVRSTGIGTAEQELMTCKRCGRVEWVSK